MYAGYWIHGKTGEVKHVYDHAQEVHSSPAEYGLTPHDVHTVTGGAAFNQYAAHVNSARGKLIHAATLKGWVRVRQGRNQTSVQLHGNAADKLKVVSSALSRMGVHVGSLYVSDFATGFEKTYQDGFGEAHRDEGLPNSAGSHAAVGRDAAATIGKDAPVLHGIPAGLPDHEVRALIRQGLHRKAGLPERRVAEAAVPSVGAANLDGPDPMPQQVTLRSTVEPPNDAITAKPLTGDALALAIRDLMAQRRANPAMEQPPVEMPSDNNPPPASTADSGPALQMPPGLR